MRNNFIFFVVAAVALSRVSRSLTNSLQSCPSLYLDGAMLTKQDTALKGHVRLNLPHASFTQCSLRCQRQDWCISINFEISQDTGQCELNDYGVEDEVMTQDLVERPGFVYSQLRPVMYGCQSNTCSNGGTCQMDCTSSKVNCVCPNGFQGDRCEIDINECSSNPCQNGGTCRDEVNSYSCTCVAGYTGSKCETNIDDCLPNSCQNGGTCTDKVNSYSCICMVGYTGSKCETMVKCDLYWPDESINNLVHVNWSASMDLSQFTVSFWMKVPASFEGELFPFTYATVTELKAIHPKMKKSSVIDIDVMGSARTVSTNFVRDNTWQHCCITWDRFNSLLPGLVTFYRNGVETEHKKDCSKDKSLVSGGKLILGQRQDSYGGGFDDEKLMVGHMTGLNIWSRAFNSSEVQALSQKCTSDQEGDVVALSDVMSSPVEGAVKKICPSTCPH